MSKYILLFVVAVVALAIYILWPREIDRKLVTAAGMGEVETLTALLGEGANIDARAVDTWTPLTAAASNGRLEIVRVLIAAGAKINKPEGGGNTALFWAALHGHIEILQFLLDNGADPNVVGWEGSGASLLRNLRERGYIEIENLLRQHGMKFD